MDDVERMAARMERLARLERGGLSLEDWEKQQARMQSELQARLQRESEIPPNFLALCRGGTVTETQAVVATVEPGTLICLSGNPGCGKTVAAAAWLFWSLPGLFVKAARLARWDRYDNDAMNRLLRAPRLVVDDLGTEYQDAKGNFMAILDELIDVRHDHARPTLITTNLDAADFKTRYGERIADRIREAGRFVSIDGASMRGKVANG